MWKQLKSITFPWNRQTEAEKVRVLTESERTSLRTYGQRHDVDAEVIVWEILRLHLPSLLTNMPTSGCTPNVWVLKRGAPTFEADRAFIQYHLPTHRILEMSGVIRER
jgi:hypothetical protein